MQKWIDTGYELIIYYGPKILMAIVIWLIGLWAIKILKKATGKALDKGSYDASLKKFLLNLKNLLFNPKMKSYFMMMMKIMMMMMIKKMKMAIYLKTMIWEKFQSKIQEYQEED